MASAIFQSFSSPIASSFTLYSLNYKPGTLALTSSQFLPPSSFLKLKNKSIQPLIRTNKFNSRVFAAQSDIFRVLQTVYKVGKDGVEAGTSLVPDSIPRPIARIAVAVVGGFIALFVLKSFLSTAFFVLAMMGVIYLAFIALNKDEAPKGTGDTTTSKTTSTTTSTEESLEEARRIMEKYK